MSENPYAIRVEELIDSARVPVAQQLVAQPERRLGGDWSADPIPFGDGMAGDADGE
jgi:hypothetical protein